MNKKHYSKVGKYISMACLLFVCAMVQSCRDEYFFDDTAPDFVGPSIYDYLDGQGNFTHFLKVIDDLDYDEVLDRTGSKTLFVADDEAFMKGIDEAWGIKDTAQLTLAHKRIILKNAMLDNAYLLEMLSKMQSQGVNAEPIPGQCLRQESSASVTDSIGRFTYKDLPKNNADWNIFRGGDSVYLALDATQPLMLHFIEDQLYQNNIVESDLDWLVAGGPKDSRVAQLSDVYIFDKKVLKEKSDITCKNGYVHQLDGLLIPPSNMAEEIRKNGLECVDVKEDGTFNLTDLGGATTQLFSRMLDRFSVPVPVSKDNEVYKTYRDAYMGGKDISLYEKRYYTKGSNRGTSGDYKSYTDAQKKTHEAVAGLSFDPGWNAYKAGTADGVKREHDMAAIFAPSDAAVINYFTKGSGTTLIDRYGKGDDKFDINGGLLRSIDSIPLTILEPLIRNHMQVSFNSSVPSKFGNIMDDARDPMGVETADIEKVILANNGAVYVMKTLYNPSRYSSVIAPVMLSDSLHIFYKYIDEIVINRGNTDKEEKYNYDQYLLSTGSKFGLIVGLDENLFYYEAADEKIDNAGKPVVTDATKPKASKFFTSKDKDGNLVVEAQVYTYNRETFDSLSNTYTSVTATAEKKSADAVERLFKEVLEHNILTSDPNSDEDRLSGKQYYASKGNAAVKVERGDDGYVEKIGGGRELQYGAMSPVAKYTKMANGHTFQLRTMIQPATQTVYNVLYATPEFQEFAELCMPTEQAFEKVLGYFLGAYDEQKKEEWLRYQIFDDILVRFFENFHYTVYVPSNEAMAEAYAKGLPTWDDLAGQIDGFGGQSNDSLRKVIKSGADLINKFVRYHIQDNSVYVDNVAHSIKTDMGGDIDGDGIHDYKYEYTVDYTTSIMNEKTKLFSTVKVYSENTTSPAGTIIVEGDISGMDNICRVVNVKETENKLYNVMTCDSFEDGTKAYAVIHLIDNFLVFGGPGGIFDPEKVNEETGEKGMFVR